MINNRSGFTLIELMTVIAIIGILAALVFVVVDPNRRFQEARDGQRATDIATIKHAIDSYTTIHLSTVDCDNIASCPTDFTITGSDDLSQILKSGNHLKSVPVAPGTPTNSLCDYHIFLYAGETDYYNLRWCYESWTKDTVDTLTGNGANYYCTWDEIEQIAVCYAGTTYDIPQP